jgi:type VI secretion system protein ImpE
MAYLLKALELLGKNQPAEAIAARDRAFELAPATKGKIDGQPFEWVADADPRLGPMLETILNGRYQWIPFSRIKNIVVEEPTDLRDLIWAGAHITLATGATCVAFVPARYPGSESAKDPMIQMGKKTDWRDAGNDLFLGVGQRLFATDAGEFPLLDTRSIELEVALTNG